MQQLLKVLRFAGNLWPYYVIITGFSVLYALSNMALPFIIKEATDLVSGILSGQAPNYWHGLWLAVALFIAEAAGTLFSNWGGYYGDIMTAKLKKQLSERYYQQLFSLPQSYYDQELTGTIINRLNRTIFDLTNFMNFFANHFFQMILTAVLTLAVVAYYSWEVAVLLFIVYPVFVWLTMVTSRSWQEYQTQKNTHTDVATGRFSEAISQMRVVKSFIQEDRELAYFKTHYGKTIGITHKQSKMWHDMDILRRLVLNLIFFLIIAFIFLQTIAGQFSLGEMLLLIQFAVLMRIPIFSMSFIVDETQRAITGSKDYFDVMNMQPAIADQPDAKELRVAHGRLQYKDVAFSYNSKDTVLRDVSFTVEPGKKVALVGESGEGKSTLTSLLMRLYEPTKGAIYIDGTNINTVTQRSLRQHIAVVFQDPALFSGSIAENIAYAMPNATPAQVQTAAKAAYAHDFITALPDGYNTQVGERGIKLSGGQKQRISIARALLKDAPILILDEATSSLDSKAEAQVQKALEVLMQGRTTLIIAHRLSTIAHVDQIVTLKNGTVHEVGSPAALAKTNGIYAELLHLQMGTTAAAKKKLKEFDIASS